MPFTVTAEVRESFLFFSTVMETFPPPICGTAPTFIQDAFGVTVNLQCAWVVTVISRGFASLGNLRSSG